MRGLTYRAIVANPHILFSFSAIRLKQIPYRRPAMHNQPYRSLLISAAATPAELELLLLTVFQCSSTVEADLQNLMAELAQGGHFFVKIHESEPITARNRATFVGLYLSNLEGFADTQHFLYSFNHQPLPPVSNHSTYPVLIALQYLDGSIQWVPLLETNHVHPLGFDEFLVELPSGLYRSVSLSEGGGLVVPIIPSHWTQSEQPYSIIPATTLMAAAQTVLAEVLPPTSFVQFVPTEVRVCFHARYSPGTGVHGDTGVSCKFLLPASDTVGANTIVWHCAWDLKAQEPFEALKTFRMALQHLHGHFAQIEVFQQALTQFKNVPSDQL